MAVREMRVQAVCHRREYTPSTARMSAVARREVAQAKVQASAVACFRRVSDTGAVEGKRASVRKAAYATRL